MFFDLDLLLDDFKIQISSNNIFAFQLTLKQPSNNSLTSNSMELGSILYHSSDFEGEF